MVDSRIDPKSFVQMSREIAGDLKLDDVCKLLKNSAPGVPVVRCSYCREQLLAPDFKISHFFALPCDDWQPELSGLDYFCGYSGGCCKTNACHNATACASTGGSSHSESLTRKPNIAKNEIVTGNRCMISESYLLLNECATTGRISTRSDGSLQCDHCLSELGWSLPASCSDNPVIQKLFHTTTDLLLVNGINESTFLNRRFGSLEHCFAWWLLTQSQSQSSLKFVVRSLDKTPRILIWLLDSYSVIDRGTLVSGSTNENCKPFPTLKVLYKLFDDQNVDGRAYDDDFSVGNLQQPAGACLPLTQLLLDSSQSLPPACRTIGQFYVGYLKLAMEWK